MSHFLENTPVFNGSKAKKTFAVELLLSDNSPVFVTVYADSEEDALTGLFPWQKDIATGVIFEVLDV
jgi:hypothetical protein